jgi:hypothetical protein
LEVKDWNSRPKRDLLRHVARTGNFSVVYTYKELYGVRVTSLDQLSLEGRLIDVTEVIMQGRYDTPLPHEDFWLARQPAPSSMLAPALPV